MVQIVFILVYRYQDRKIKVVRAFENFNLLEYYCNKEGITYTEDIELNDEGYYVYRTPTE